MLGHLSAYQTLVIKRPKVLSDQEIVFELAKSLIIFREPLLLQQSQKVFPVDHEERRVLSAQHLHLGSAARDKLLESKEFLFLGSVKELTSTSSGRKLEMMH
jgi:hypothetical protein